MSGYLAGWFDEQFMPIRRASSGGSSSAFKVESFNRSSKVEFAFVNEEQFVLVEKFISIVREINMEMARINDDFKEKLKSHNHQLELHLDWSKPEKI